MTSDVVLESSRPATDYDDFRAAVLDLITLRNERLEAMLELDPDYQAALEDLENEYIRLIETVNAVDKLEIGKFWSLALEVLGSPEDIFANYPDAAGLMLMLQIPGARRGAMENLRRAASLPPAL